MRPILPAVALASLLAACASGAPAPSDTASAPPSTGERPSAGSPEVPAFADAPAPGMPSAPGSLLRAVTTDRSRYAPGEEASVALQIRNDGAAPVRGTLHLRLVHEGMPAAAPLEQPIALETGEETTAEFSLLPPSEDFRGYLLEAWVSAEDGSTVDARNGALDVSSDWARFPRYGFLSRFDEGVDADAALAAMNEFHLNGVQFYDWAWQHHRPYSPELQWPDIANRPIDGQTVRELIDASHERGMVAMSYGLINGAYDRYWEDGSGMQLAWGLFRDGGGNYDPARQDQHGGLPSGWAAQTIQLFDPSHPDYQRFAIDRKREVFDHFDFDGWHVDSLGDRGPLWRWDGSSVDLASTFVPFLERARGELDRRIVFNTVGAYGQDAVAESEAVDFVYTEIWESAGIERWSDVLRVIRQAQERSDKAVVLAAYINRGKNQSTADGQTGLFNEAAVRLFNAATFAAGASHIELGDGAGMLSTEYFPAQKLAMDEATRGAVLDQYHFLTAYQNLLRDGLGPTDARVEVDGVATSEDGRAGTIWTMARERADGTPVFHLINLLSATDEGWRDEHGTQPQPQTATDLQVRLRLPDGAGDGWRVGFASPDLDHGSTRWLESRQGADEQGAYLEVTVPSLTYWDMIWVERS